MQDTYTYFHSSPTLFIVLKIMDEGHHHFYQNSQLFVMTRQMVIDNCFHDNFIISLQGLS